mgnify:CR=1 FL=1
MCAVVLDADVCEYTCRPDGFIFGFICKFTANPLGPEGFQFRFCMKICAEPPQALRVYAPIWSAYLRGSPSGPEGFSFDFVRKFAPYPLWP